MSTLHNYGLIRFNKQTGENDMIMTAIGKGLLQSWALQNTPKNKACVIVNIDKRCTAVEIIGSADGFPKFHKNVDEFEYNVPDELFAIFDEEVAKRRAGA